MHLRMHSHISEVRWYKFVVGTSRASNNMAEMKALNCIPILALHHGIMKLHIYEDSQLLIEWFILKKAPKNITRKPFSEYILRYMGLFQEI